MIIAVATMRPRYFTETVWPSWASKMHDREPQCIMIDNSENNRGVVGAYEEAYQRVKRERPEEQVIAYIHDDVEIYEHDWDQRVTEAFRSPRVGLVGFGGAVRHGAPELYKVPYRLVQLARDGYRSNTKDAESHGLRFGGSLPIVFPDGFCLIVRRELLERCGGWQPEKWPSHHVYDMVISAQARRYGYSIMMVGISCQHRGGETATAAKYNEWAATTKWGSDAAMHEQGHRLFYDEFRDVMPAEVRL